MCCCVQEGEDTLDVMETMQAYTSKLQSELQDKASALLNACKEAASFR